MTDSDDKADKIDAKVSETKNETNGNNAPPSSETVPQTNDIAQIPPEPIVEPKKEATIKAEPTKAETGTASQPTQNPETKKPIEMPTSITNNSAPDNLVPDNLVKDNSKPIIQKRGGIGLFTATFLSCIAALGGAYLALFVEARPDLMQDLKIAPFLPKNAQLSDLNAIQSEVADIQKQLKDNNQPVNIPAPNAQNQAGQTQLGQNQAGQANSPNANGDAQIPLQNANPSQAQIAQAQAQGSLEPLRADMAGLSGRLTAIETRLAALDPTGTGGAIIAALQTEVATLKVTVANLQQQVAQTPSPNTTFAVMSLAEAANRNGSFLPEYEAVRAALPYLPEVAPLESYAKTGVPTRDMLRQNFAAISNELVKNGNHAQKQEKGFWGFIKGLFAKAFKVEVKENNPNTIDQILNRAKSKLDGDDLQGAIAELQNVQNPPQSLLQWIENAKHRQDLEVKISALRSAIERNMYVQGQIVNPALSANGTPAANNNAVNQQQPNQQYPQLPQQPAIGATNSGGNAK